MLLFYCFFVCDIHLMNSALQTNMRGNVGQTNIWSGADQNRGDQVHRTYIQLRRNFENMRIYPVEKRRVKHDYSINPCRHHIFVLIVNKIWHIPLKYNTFNTCKKSHVLSRDTANRQAWKHHIPPLALLQRCTQHIHALSIIASNFGIIGINC